MAQILGIKDIRRGASDKQYQYYQIFMTDTDGNECVASVGCKVYHQEACEKTFRRLTLVPAPEELEKLREMDK